MNLANKLRIGNTPIVKLDKYDQHNDDYDSTILTKLELFNPTGSHKDRESLEIINYCTSRGIKEVGCASTGNFGISLAYLSNIFKVKCHVWVSNQISPFRESYLKAFGANINKVEGDLFQIYKLSSYEMKSRGIYDANPGGNKIKMNANKKIFEEIIRDVPSITSILTCINNGTHYLGLSEAAHMDKIPVYAVFTYDSRAKSIGGFSAYEGLDKINKMIQTNKGSLIEASSEDINQGLRCSKKNGLIVEASSAAVIGVALRLRLRKGKTCCIITGNGLKYPEEISLNK